MPTTVLRPSATAASYNATAVPSGTFNAITSDNSDATYARLGNSPWGGNIRVALPTGAVPAGAAARSATVRTRARAAVATGRVATALNSGPYLLGNAYWDVTSSFGDYSASPVVVSAVDVDRLSLYVEQRGNDTQPAIDVAELYVDVLYATQPTVTVLTPSGVILVTDPTISWAHTPGVDGGGPAAWEVWVYNAAQYSATGFNPGQSVPFWSGSGGGTASTVQPGVQLVDDDYRVYVRSAQSINGQPHWSSFAFSSFTVDSDPPPAPTITATPDDANGRVRIVVTIDDTVSSVIGVQHSTDGGQTWLPVRGATRAEVVAETWVGYDAEGPNGKPTMYRAQAIRPTVNGDIASAWSAPVSTTWASPFTWLKDIRNPNRSRTVRFSVMPEPTRDRAQGVFAVLNAVYPTVNQGRLQATAGTAQLLTATESEADDLLELLATDTLMLQTPASHRWGSRYIKPGAVQELRPIRIAQVQYRVWSFPYTEVAAPPDDGVTQLAGLTWQDIIDTYPTWQAFINAVPAWGVLF